MARLEARVRAPLPLWLLHRVRDALILSDQRGALRVESRICLRVEVHFVIGVPSVGQRDVLVFTGQVGEVVIHTI